MTGRVTLYGIRNCGTVKKARAWLDGRGVSHGFHDFKTAGLEREKLGEWVEKVGWETLLNRSGTTFRKLPDDEKADLDEAKAMRLMLDQPSMVKRPVLENGADVLVGFRPERYDAALRGQRRNKRGPGGKAGAQV